MAFREAKRERCPACKAEVPSSAVRVEGAVGHASCPACGFEWAFDAPGFASHASELRTEAAAARDESSDDAPPPGVEVKEEGNALVIRRRWFGLSTMLYGFLLVLWGTLSLAMIGGPDVLALAAASIGLLVLGYPTLLGLLNRTTLRVDPDALRVRHGPLPAPWAKRHTLPTARIEQLFVVAVRVRSLRDGGSDRVWFELRAALRDSPPVTLLGRVELQAQALHIERRIETHLGVEDAGVGRAG